MQRCMALNSMVPQQLGGALHGQARSNPLLQWLVVSNSYAATWAHTALALPEVAAKPHAMTKYCSSL
jgi:hypothetical protein